jgi:hypothetical protein
MADIESTSSENQTSIINIHIFIRMILYTYIYISSYFHVIDALLFCEVLWVQIQNLYALNWSCIQLNKL